MTSIKKQLVVEASQDRAFRVFTDGIDRWWPREHHIGTSPLERAIIEPRPGGRWYSTCKDGSQIDVGKVVVWEPPDRVVLTWQITSEWRFDPSFVTEVEVRFIVEGPRRTRVELEHRDVEKFGPEITKTFDSESGWSGTLGHYGRALGLPKHVMQYETSPDSLAKAPHHLAAHRERLDLFHARGTLLMAGNLLDKTGRALGIFTSRAAAEEFVREDPFVVHGVVTAWSIAEWNEVLA